MIRHGPDTRESAPPSRAPVGAGTPAAIHEWTTRSDGPTPRAPVDGCRVGRACRRSAIVFYFEGHAPATPAE